MKAGTITLQTLFGNTISYRIPLFQRPYVWTEDRNWQPLWDDIASTARKLISGSEPKPHFLGAIVVDQLPTPLGRIEQREIIDGQQRLTTLQILLVAARDFCVASGMDHQAKRFTTLISNDAVFVNEKSEQNKVWPTNRDRQAFLLTMEAGSLSGLKGAFEISGNPKDFGHKIPSAYAFFWRSLREFVEDENELDLGSAPSDKRVESIWLALQTQMVLVSIDLESDDDAQIIFETLNARGTPLLPADLVKNFLFHRAELAKCNSEELYEKYWHDFDEKFWRSEVVQGRLRRPRIDLFLQNYLTLKLRDEVPATEIFRAFQRHFGEAGFGTASGQGIEAGLKQLRDYGNHFAAFYRRGAGTRIEEFFERMEIMQTATIFPLLLEVFHRLTRPEDMEQIENICLVLESYLVRRMICGLTTKNYNRLFLDLIQHCSDQNDFGVETIRSFLDRQESESARWPNDSELREAWVTQPIYQRITRPRLRMVLLALEEALRHDKSEVIARSNKLTVEHLLPQTWQNTWPLPQVEGEAPEARLKRVSDRTRLLHSVGNLTLITRRLNPAVSNSPWEKKRPDLLKYSQLSLSRDLHDAADWNEDAILARSNALFVYAAQLWPR